MSDLTFNKIAGAVLATGLAIVGLRELSAGVFAPQPAEKAGYLVEVAEETGGAAEVELPPDWGTVLPAADLAAGEAAFAKCKSCHTIAPGGANGTGPNIYGVVGAKPGVHAGFAYSSAIAAFASEHPVWTYDELNEFIQSPSKHMPGTKMTFVGIKRTDERVNLIAYMAAQGGKLALPAPDPSRQPAAAAPAEGEAAAPEATGPATGATGPGATPAPASGAPTGQGPGAPASEVSPAAPATK
jgi:cytochrome c